MEEIDSKAIRHAAMGLLARREHSDLELQQKLSYRFPDEAERVRVEVEQLTAEGLQSNTRLAESVIRTRISRGQGPSKIIHDLKIKGVDQEDILFALGKAEVNWFTLASEVAVKKFGIVSGDDADFQFKGRLSRFLQQRGFSYDHIASVYLSL